MVFLPFGFLQNKPRRGSLKYNTLPFDLHRLAKADQIPGPVTDPGGALENNSVRGPEVSFWLTSVRIEETEG